MKPYGKRDYSIGTRKGTEPSGRKAQARREAREEVERQRDDLPVRQPAAWWDAP